MKKVSVLLNPSSGGGRSLRLRKTLEKCLRKHGLDYQVVVTESELHMREMIVRLAMDSDVLALAGGDSSMMIAVNELKMRNLDIPIAFIPMGSCNDLGREFGLFSIYEACAALRRNRIRRIDLGVLSDSSGNAFYFLGQASLGLGVEVNRRMADIQERHPRISRRKTLAGAWCTWRAVNSPALPVHLKVGTPEKMLEGDFLLAVVSNIRYYGGGIPLFPDARPDDGHLELSLVSQSSFPRLVKMFRDVQRGEGQRISEMKVLSSNSFHITSDEPFTVQVEGEIYRGDQNSREGCREVMISVLPSSVSLIV